MPSSLRQHFISPENEFGPVPFWFLNGKFSDAEIRRQMEDFRRHGVWGVVVHPRIGFDPDIPYLSEEYFRLMRFIVQTAEELQMLIVLYDEAMYPSGSAGGLVVKENPAYAAKGLMMVEGPVCPPGRVVAHVAMKKTGEKSYKVHSGRLLQKGNKLLPDESEVWLVQDFTGGTIRGLYPGQDDHDADAPTAADILDPEAVNCFVRLTHDQYYEQLAPYFGSTIYGFFTDEPNPLGRCAKEDMVPWTDELDQIWVQTGYSLADLPMIWWDGGPQTEDIRAGFAHMISRREEKVYYQALRDWCDEHKVWLSGHPGPADNIRLERRFSMPGQDLVWRFVEPGKKAITGPESTLAQCAADSARHLGKRRCSCEAFGCCGPEGSQWGMTVADMKWMLDWLFVRGINAIVPHAFFYDTSDLSKLDRPPDVGPNNYWWRNYNQISRYIARMCRLNTDNVSGAKVAVLTMGDHLPWQYAEALQRHQIPFHYLEPKELVAGTIEGDTLCVGEQRYTALIQGPIVAKKPEVYAKIQELMNAGVAVLMKDQGGRQTSEDMAQELLSLGCSPVQLNPPCDDIRVSYVMHGDAHVLMVFNEGSKPYEGQISMPILGYCEQWDPWRGTMYATGAPRRRHRVRLKPWDNQLFVLSKKAPEDARDILPLPVVPPLVHQISLSARFTLVMPDGREIPVPQLGSWQKIRGLEKYNGSLTYRVVLHVPDVFPEHVIINLGEVHEMAEIAVNGKALCPLLIPPYSANLAPYLHSGDNLVEVKVTSTFVTKYEDKSWPCGLFGPVTLIL